MFLQVAQPQLFINYSTNWAKASEKRLYPRKKKPENMDDVFISKYYHIDKL